MQWAETAKSVGLHNDIEVAAFDEGAVTACEEMGLRHVPIFEANGSSTTDFGGVATGGMTLDGKQYINTKCIKSIEFYTQRTHFERVTDLILFLSVILFIVFIYE